MVKILEKNLLKTFQIAVVFIGTIVGAGLASGKEITEFFTMFGAKSFICIPLCGIFYIIIGSILAKIGSEYKLNSYSDAIKKISPNILGKLTGVITTLYLISSASIILAGSGAIINQFFGIPKIAGSIIMFILASIFLLRDTNGLIEINSLIVPLLLTSITLIVVLYFIFCKDTVSFQNIASCEPKKSGVLISTILYSGYNILCCSGVIIPLSNETNNHKIMKRGIILGSIFLTLLCLMINLLLTVNTPYIYEYEIPLLFVAHRFGPLIQAILVMVILLEMFSTEVSDVYSISKTLVQTFKIKFKKAIFIVLFTALPISQIGFTNLITTLYPVFGVLSLIFITQSVIFYFKNNLSK